MAQDNKYPTKNTFSNKLNNLCVTQPSYLLFHCYDCLPSWGKRFFDPNLSLPIRLLSSSTLIKPIPSFPFHPSSPQLSLLTSFTFPHPNYPSLLLTFLTPLANLPVHYACLSCLLLPPLSMLQLPTSFTFHPPSYTTITVTTTTCNVPCGGAPP